MKTTIRTTIQTTAAIAAALILSAGAWSATAKDTRNLDGAKVFAANCGSCHSERYPAERNDYQWRIIVKHMRVRSNMTGAEARAVLRYLQENNNDGHTPEKAE